MKQTKILSLLMALIFAANVAAEDQAEPSMNPRFGAFVGTNFSSMNYRYYTYRNDVLGWQAGGTMDIPISSIKMGSRYSLITVQPELMFTAKGSESSYLLTGGYELSAYYIEVPVSGTFKFIINPNFAVKANLGPYFACGLFGTAEYPVNDKNTFDDVSRFDIGLHYGVTIEFLQGFFFTLAFNNGWTDDHVESFYQTLGYFF